MPELHQQTIQDERLRELTLACPDCGARMNGTGKMYYSATAKRWLVEYWCPADRETREIWTPEVDKLADELTGGR